MPFVTCSKCKCAYEVDEADNGKECECPCGHEFRIEFAPAIPETNSLHSLLVTCPKCNMAYELMPGEIGKECPYCEQYRKQFKPIIEHIEQRIKQRKKDYIKDCIKDCLIFIWAYFRIMCIVLGGMFILYYLFSKIFSGGSGDTLTTEKKIELYTERESSGASGDITWEIRKAGNQRVIIMEQDGKRVYLPVKE